jgi:hypothetical protein
VEGLCPCNEGGIREAIDEGAGRYTFDCDGPTTVITGREIVIENDVTLDGGGNLTVDANRRHRVFSVPDGVTAELVRLNVTNGNQTEENGGGIRNEGTLTLRSSTVSGCSTGRPTGCRTDNAALLCSEGGGIWNVGTLTLMNSTVSGSSSNFGGGLANRGGSLTLIDSEVRTSSATGCSAGAVVCSGGGGIWNAGALTMMNSRVSESTADWGGGIYNQGVPTLANSAVLTNTTISGNSAGFDGGGLLNFQTLTLIDSTVADNTADQSGGGVANAGGTFEVNRSTFSDNIAVAAGGGIFNLAGATTNLLNATVSGNAAETGGGIYTGGALSLLSSTMVGNDAPVAGAIYDPGTSNADPRSIARTLIEGDCEGERFESGGHNVESPGNTCLFDQQTDQTDEDQIDLGPLTDNGGPTETHALLGDEQSNVAIDRIPEADCINGAGDPLETDQRGKLRPAGESSSCDVGAFEAQP